MADRDPNIDAVVSFWREAGYEAWYKRSDDFDRQIRDRFGALHSAAARGAHDDWAQSAPGALALLIVLDQFSRNLYRGDARAFAQDAQARAVAHKAIKAGFDAEVAETVDHALRPFFYMPFMHSEDLEDQDYCVERFREIDNADGLKYAEIHRDVIAKFGRFPHRNPALGRTMTDDEQAFLDDGGFSA